MQVRHTAAVHVSGPIRRLNKVRKPQQRTASPITMRVHDMVLEEAIRLAGGDPARLRINHDGTVTVVNRRHQRTILPAVAGPTTPSAESFQ